MIMLITYGTVIVQVAFPFTLFNRRLKNVLLVAMICEHLSIAFLLGLPFFSLAMITRTRCSCRRSSWCGWVPGSPPYATGCSPAVRRYASDAVDGSGGCPPGGQLR